jgi:phage tail sheath protein FI
MPTNYLNTPGVQINEVQLGPPPIAGVGTSTAGFVGESPLNRFTDQAMLITSVDQFRAVYVLKDPPDPNNPAHTISIETGKPQNADATVSTDLSRAVFGFFANGGQACYVVNTNSVAAADIVAGIKLLEVIDEVAIIAAPGQTQQTVYGELQSQATRTGDRFALLDPPTSKANPITQLTAGGSKRPPADSIYSAFYYPRIMVGPDLPDDVKTPVAVTPIGHVAGVYARVDASRGVHKAPANAAIFGALDVEYALTDADQNVLNQQSVNLIRVFSEGVVIWGARTLSTDTTYRYINVRRLVNYIEESLQEGLRWAVFEPNTLPLRKQITRAVRGFLDGVWRDGGLFGATADDAYYVRFPDIYNTVTERSLGKLTLEIGLRVSYPAEFIIVRIGVLTQDEP